VKKKEYNSRSVKRELLKDISLVQMIRRHKIRVEWEV